MLPSGAAVSKQVEGAVLPCRPSPLLLCRCHHEQAYGAVFHYNVWTWAAGAATPFNVTFTQGTSDPGPWLEVVKMYGRPGQEEIVPGDVVTLR